MSDVAEPSTTPRDPDELEVFRLNQELLHLRQHLAQVELQVEAIEQEVPASTTPQLPMLNLLENRSTTTDEPLSTTARPKETDEDIDAYWDNFIWNADDEQQPDEQQPDAGSGEQQPAGSGEWQVTPKAERILNDYESQRMAEADSESFQTEVQQIVLRGAVERLTAVLNDLRAHGNTYKDDITGDEMFEWSEMVPVSEAGSSDRRPKTQRAVTWISKLEVAKKLRILGQIRLLTEEQFKDL